MTFTKRAPGLCSRCKSAQHQPNGCYCRECRNLQQTEWRRRAGRRPYGKPGNPSLKRKPSVLDSYSGPMGCSCRNPACNGMMCERVRA